MVLYKDSACVVRKAPKTGFSRCGPFDRTCKRLGRLILVLPGYKDYKYKFAAKCSKTDARRKTHLYLLCINQFPSTFSFTLLAHLSHWLMMRYCDRWMSVVSRVSSTTASIGHLLLNYWLEFYLTQIMPLGQKRARPRVTCFTY